MKQSTFLEKLKSNPHFVNGYFTVISDYTCDKCKVLVQTPYGICSCDPYSLYGIKSKPSINTAVDKNKYFSNYIASRNSFYKNGDFEIISDFKGFNKKKSS